jgi:hypothetical protein
MKYLPIAIAYLIMFLVYSYAIYESGYTSGVTCELTRTPGGHC